MVRSMITNHLIKASIIEEKQRELYEYSIKSLFGNVLNIVSCLAIGVLCGECVRAIIFFYLSWLRLEVRLRMSSKKLPFMFFLLLAQLC